MQCRVCPHSEPAVRPGFGGRGEQVWGRKVHSMAKDLPSSFTTQRVDEKFPPSFWDTGLYSLRGLDRLPDSGFLRGAQAAAAILPQGAPDKAG